MAANREVTTGTRGRSQAKMSTTGMATSGKLSGVIVSPVCRRRTSRYRSPEGERYTSIHSLCTLTTQ
jgi:hypothetical protein